MDKTKNSSRLRLLAGLALTAILIIFPMRTLVATALYERACSIVREAPDPESRETDAEKIVQNYLAAIRSLEWAIAVAPTRSVYYKALSDVYVRLGRWTTLLELMGVPLPEGTPASMSSFADAETALKKAIDREPTNPDYHFSLAELYDTLEPESGKAEKELERAIRAYPVNAALRYAVALQHLNAGRKGEALEQAAILARIEGTNFSYKSRLWLIRAFDVAWRASKDPQVVRGVAPEESDAMPVLKAFLKEKAAHTISARKQSAVVSVPGREAGKDLRGPHR